MTKTYFRRWRFFIFAVFIVLAFLSFDKRSEWSLAQHRAERRPAATKPKSNAKPPTPSRTRNAQQQVNADGSITGTPWFGEYGVMETTAEIMSREHTERAVRTAKGRLKRPSEREPEHEHIRINRDHLPQNPEALPGAKWPPAGDGETGRQDDGVVGLRSPALQLSPSPTLSFTAATLADTTSFPPDTMGAVGPTQFLMAVNGRIRVFNKSTGAKGELDADIDSFFNSVRGGQETTDPQARYDRLSGRWFVLIINIATTNNRVMLAVSDGATINSATVWTFYYFEQNLATPSGDNGCFADYPSLGIDASALYVGVNQFCNRAFTNTTGFVIRKSSVLGGGQIVVSAFRNLIERSGSALGNGIFSPHGVDNPDPNATAGYFVGTDSNSFGRLVLRRVSNPGGVPVLSPNLYVNVLATSTPITVRHKGNFNGVNGRLDALDDRLLSAHLRNGSLWAAHNIAVNNTGTTDVTRTRNAVRWYEVADLASPAPRLQQAGTLFTQTDTNTEDERNYWMPSLAVSGQGHVLVGYNTAGTNEYINAALAVRWATDPFGTLQTPQLFTASPAPYNPSSNSGNQQGSRRWGDYSFTSVDPCDDMTMWTIQQFGDAVNSYGLRVARIAAPPPAAPAAASPQSIAVGQASVNVTITGISVTGAGFYDPGEGFNCRLTASVTGGVAVNNISYINPTTMLLNLSTVNASAGMQTVTITNPDGQVATGNNILSVGNCAYNVTANNQNFNALGGTGTISVETASGCGWTAISNGSDSSFISINSGSTGSGTGTVSFTVAPTSGGARSGTLLVAGQAITITQSAGEGCSYALSPDGRNFPATGGTGSFNVTAAPECVWAATTGDPFVNILFASAGQGSGTVNFIVLPNDQPSSRSAKINVGGVGGQMFNLTQDAPPFEVAVDDGTFESSTGISTGGTSYRVNRLTPAFYPATINAVAIYFPNNGSVKSGDPFTIVTGVNADGDTNIDGTAFQTIPAQVQELGAFTVVAVPPITITQGDFVVGLHLNQIANTFPFALDTTGSNGRSYRSLDGVTFATADSLGTAGNYGIRARLVRPAKLIVGAGASLAAESCQPANRAIDPGETVTLNLSLANNGSNSTQNLLATLVASANVLTAGQSEPAKSFGALAPGAPAVARQFSFTSSGACGSLIPVTLRLTDGGEDLGTVSFNFTLGAAGATPQVFSYNGGAVNIPDSDVRGVSVPLTVSGFAGNIADLNFRIDGTDCTASTGATSVGVDHSWAGDLVFKLTSPAGTTVTIINRAGGSGNNGKNFCQTTLDDDAASATSINNVTSTGAPYTGTFKPSNPLSVFDGENPNGTWTLTAIDESASDSGSVRAFSLLLTGFACCSTGCLDVASISANSGAAGSSLTITGAGFSGVTAVRFGDAAAAFTVINNNSITATVPASARIAPIILSKAGCVDAQTQVFTAFPTITLTPATATVTAGLTNSVRVNLGYSPSNSTIVTLTSSNPSVAAVPASVLITAGAMAADFNINGLAPGGPLTITARLPANLGGGIATASVTVAARAVSIVGGEASIGRSVAVPIVLESKGDETSVGFSLSFAQALFINPQLAAGSDSGSAQLNLNSSQAAQGRIGVTISQPLGQKFAAGLRQIAVVSFDVPATAQPVTAAIDFGDQPVARAVGGTGGASILAQFVAGSIRLGQGYEADVAPRPAGNNSGNVTVSDWVQIGRFVAGLDVPANGSEFQRADCAPLSSLGDGKIALTDWVQAGRYVAAFDAAVVAGGPTAPVVGIGPDFSFQISDSGSMAATAADARRLKVVASGGILSVQLTAFGDENALGFSLNFDPQAWRFVAARAGRDALAATVIVNASETAQGRVGILLALPSGQSLRAGEREAVVLQFTPRRRAVLLNARFGDVPVATSLVDSTARPLSVRRLY
ncbi:MAG: proprotein convertase P-domain-containing protein [Acidobacteriota bacterium]